MEEKILKELSKMNDQIEKLLILDLLKNKVKRDDITKLLKISSVKVSSVQKYLKNNK